MRTSRGYLFPNLYVILVGPAGAGKTIAASEAYDIIKELENHHIAPTAVSRASLIDSLFDAERKVVLPKETPPVMSYNALAIYSNELGTLIPAYENDFIHVLTDLYDGKRYQERKRTAKLELTMPNPVLNFLAATTPSFLNQLLPEGAWDQGFISRTTLVYSGPGADIDLFDQIETDTVMQSALVNDLRQIGADSFSGGFSFEPDAVEAIRAWAKSGYEPRPSHPKLQHYVTRRPPHLLKLCMISSASTSNSRIVTLDNYVEAFGWLCEVEHAMNDIFKSMQVGGAARIVDETWFWAYEWWLKHKKEKPIPEGLLWEFMSARAPIGDVPRLIDYMIRTGVLKEVLVPSLGKCYEVKGRR